MAKLSKAERIINELSEIFNREVEIYYNRKEQRWSLSLRGLYPCHETNSTARYQDGTVEKLMAAGHSASGWGKTFLEAARKLEQNTVGRAGFVTSNQTFGLFSMDDDDGPHIITVYEGRNKVEEFPYEKERVRAAIHKYEKK